MGAYSPEILIPLPNGLQGTPLERLDLLMNAVEAGKSVMTLRQHLLLHSFAVDSADLTPEHDDILSHLASLMKRRQKQGENIDAKVTEILLIEGRASATGPDAHNDQLSGQRAERVKARLEELLPTPIPDAALVPLGESSLIVPTNAENDLNRSVEITFDVELRRPNDIGQQKQWNWIPFHTLKIPIGPVGLLFVEAGDMTRVRNGEPDPAESYPCWIMALGAGASVGQKKGVEINKGLVKWFKDWRRTPQTVKDDIGQAANALGREMRGSSSDGAIQASLSALASKVRYLFDPQAQVGSAMGQVKHTFGKSTGTFYSTPGVSFDELLPKGFNKGDPFIIIDAGMRAILGASAGVHIWCDKNVAANSFQHGYAKFFEAEASVSADVTSMLNLFEGSVLFGWLFRTD